MVALLETAAALVVGFGGNIIKALLIFIIGKMVIGKIVKLLSGSKSIAKVDPTIRGFALSAVKIGLYIVMVIMIIKAVGVDTTAFITALASAGVAVGLALQGALANVAGGIMLMIFRPFKVGDYVDASGASGTVEEITLFYTVFRSLDNKRITVPNGGLMNANVVNYSTEPLRRVDLTFSCAKGQEPGKIQDMLMTAVMENKLVLTDPAPFARFSGGTNEAMEFTVRAWCKNEDYWTVYFDLLQNVTETLGKNGVPAPAMRVLTTNVEG